MKDKILEVIDSFRKGNFAIVVDDKNRENEADLFLAAEKATPEKINFMIKNARGLVCVPMLGKRLDELKLRQMTDVNTEFHHCKFTVSVDLKHGTTTGISAFDRAKTIKALADENFKAADFSRPGHVFPLRCSESGLGKRTGHTEAAIELCRLAGMYPAAAICEIIGEDGRMAKFRELSAMSKKYKIPIVRIQELAK